MVMLIFSMDFDGQYGKIKVFSEKEVKSFGIKENEI